MNIWDGILGVLMAFWLNDLANDVFTATSTRLISIPIELAKGLFITGSIVYVASLARVAGQWEAYIGEVSPKTTVRGFLTKVRAVLIILFSVYGFLLTTYYIFPTNFSIYRFIFFALLLPTWLISMGLNRIDLLSSSKKDNNSVKPHATSTSIREPSPRMPRSPRKNSYRRLLVALLAASLIIIRALFPYARFDDVSLILFGVIFLAVILPNLGQLATSIRRFRIGDFELELAEKVEKLSEQAEEAEEAQSRQPSSLQKAKEILPEVAKRLAEAATDPRSALLLVAIEIEQSVQRLARQHKIPDRASAFRLMSQLAEKNIISQEIVALFQDFWQVRNQIIHQAGFDVPKGQIYKLVDIGIIILKLLPG